MSGCLLCGCPEDVKLGGFCGVECVRWFKLLDQLRRLEGVLIEVKYELRGIRDRDGVLGGGARVGRWGG